MTRRLSGYAIAGALAGTTSLLTADIIATNWDDPNTYGYLTMYMPDFDQLRLGDLPNDGRCHCGPTGAASLLAWIANHGFPEYAPGQANWQSQANYDLATDIIDEITNEYGSFSDGTVFGCGTGLDEVFLNLQGRVGDRFTVNLMTNDLANGQGVTLSDVAQVGVQGGIMGLAYGRWNWTPVGSARRLDSRGGGHFVVLSVLSSGDGVEGSLGVRDPGDAGLDAVQSTFTNRFWDFTRRTVYQNTGGGVGPLVQVDELYNDTPPDSSNRMRIFEGYISVVPRQGITWEPFDNGLQVLTPDGPVWNEGVFDLDIDLLPEVREVVPGPYGRTIYLRTEPGKLLCIRLVDGSIVELEPPNLTSPIRGFEIDAFQRLGLITPTDFRVYQVNDLQEEPRVVPLKFAPTDLAWIEWSGPRDGPWFKPRAVVLGGTNQRLSIVKLVDGAPPSVATYTVPSSIPLKETTRMVYGGSPASFFFTTEGMVHRAAFNQQGELEELPMQLSGVGEVDDLDVDDQDRVVVSTQGKTIAFRQTDNFNWVVDPEHPFIDLPVNRRFRMVRSRSNWDPRFRDPPSQEPDPLVPELPFEPDCLGDLDLDGQVNGADLAALLAAWLEERSIADLDRSGQVNGADLAIMLGAWGLCSQ